MSKIFIDNVKLDTHTVYMQNGRINIYPEDYEYGQNVTCGCNVLSQKGRMVTEHDGTSHFKPFNHSGKSRYKNLFETLTGLVFSTRKNIIFRVKMPKRLGKEEIIEQVNNQVAEMLAYVRCRNVEAAW